MLGLRTRWRRVGAGDLDAIAQRLIAWPCPPGGAVRHMFALDAMRTRGPSVVRVASSGDDWACSIVLPGQLIVPCGDADVIEAAGVPQKRWRLLVGDADAADAVLRRWGLHDPGLIVHVQRFMTVDPERVPLPGAVPDPGLRAAVPADASGLAELAVQLHLDDGYGPHPGRAGLRAYRQRVEGSIQRGSILTLGEPGDPLLKVELSVDSARYGVQLSGICVREEERGRGLGLAAVTEAVRRATSEDADRPISLHVRADNERAIHTYVRAGFVDREEWRLAVRS